ncbi:MAG TPA: response regulator [Candidatus Paceibacterota bacterium]
MTEEKKYKIIIVDDDQFLLDMYVLKFKKEGIDVESFYNGEELLKKLKDNLSADLLLLDIIIPGMDGLSVLEQIRKEKLAGGMKIVMLTNQGDPEEIKKAESFGVNGYIIKATAIPSEVVEKVKKILNAN